MIVSQFLSQVRLSIQHCIQSKMPLQLQNRCHEIWYGCSWMNPNYFGDPLTFPLVKIRPQFPISTQENSKYLIIGSLPLNLLSTFAFLKG